MTFYLTLFILFCYLGMGVVFLLNLIHLGKQSLQDAPREDLKISILIPARNEEKNLRRLIPSLLEQQFETFELIIYDDASEDDTWRVINSFEDDRIHALQGKGPPAGWAGKVHALYQAVQTARGDAFLFLDADTLLKSPGALGDIVAKYQQMPAHSVLTGMPHYKGEGLLLVSLVTHALLVSIPWGLLRWLPFSSMSALNGQCWMIDARLYRQHEPHKQVAGEVLEDVSIGRYLKKMGISPFLVDLQQELAVYMYPSFNSAWLGFRKNVYLLMGNNPVSFLFVFLLFGVIFVAAPMIDPRMFILLYLNKLATDLRSRFSPWISLGAPLSFLLGSTLQIDSAWSNLIGNVQWKGRKMISR